MKTSRSSEQQPLMVPGNVLKATVLGLVGALIFTMAMAIGYQAENQASQ